MEKFYQVDPLCRLHSNYINYLEDSSAACRAFNSLAEKYGIETSEFYPGTSRLAIVPTEKDRVTFEKQLTKRVRSQGLIFFKVGSKIGKEWAEIVKDLRNTPRPRVSLNLKEFIPRATERIFALNGIVYCSIDTETEYVKPEWLQEMKASEFFKVIEDHNEREGKGW
jgi:hypothetical protein